MPESQILSDMAHAVLSLARDYYQKTGEGTKLSTLVQDLEISSRRKVRQIVKELKQAPGVRVDCLEERGKPLIIIPENDTK